jgi:hypothetical protein
LSRKYAYQVLLTEELARHGVSRWCSSKRRTQAPRKINC